MENEHFHTKTKNLKKFSKNFGHIGKIKKQNIKTKTCGGIQENCVSKQEH